MHALFPSVFASGASEHLIGLVLVLVLGIGAKWVSWRLRLPAILVLLLTGFVAGWLEWIDPEGLYGELLNPIVSLSVALILFEGGMTLQSSELPEVWRVVRNLITIGTLATWVVLTAAGTYVLNLDITVSALLGAILVVSGPTVIGPMLREIRPNGAVGSILKWEGIVIDPVGVMLAVLVFTAMQVDPSVARTEAVLVVLKTVLFGGLLGIAGAGLLTLMLRRFWVPDHLQNPVALTMVVVVFSLSNALQDEAGLLATTLMGVVLANQKHTTVRHIFEFKENLRVLIISSLFILLAAQVKPAELFDFDHPDRSFTPFGLLLYFVAIIFVARPLAVFLSTIRSDLNWRERVFLSFMSPKGIVAAALASLLATDLGQVVDKGGNMLYPAASQIMVIAFLMIFGTVAFYGVLGGPIARGLGLAQSNPQGFLILSAHPFARAIARELMKQDVTVMVADSNRGNVRQARMENIPAYYGDILSEHAEDEIELHGIGRFLALTPNDEVNTLACMHYAELFDRANVYQLARTESGASAELGGRTLFRKNATWELLNIRYSSGAVIKSTTITDEFSEDDYMQEYGDVATRLFQVSPEGKIEVCTPDQKPGVEPETTIISLVYED